MVEDLEYCITWSKFDCRNLLLPEIEPEYTSKVSDKYLREYMQVKNGIAKWINPNRICEIGVSSGISALAFLDACPNAEYVGIDNRFEEQMRDVQLVDRAIELLKSYKAKVHILDSQELGKLPDGPFDMVHVDGCHTKEATYHDVILAWNALLPGGWIVVDDAKDSAVACGTFEALLVARQGNCEWLYLENSWTGNILIHKEETWETYNRLEGKDGLSA